jgi:hypothetical protein
MNSFGMVPAITPLRANYEILVLNRRIDETAKTYLIFDDFIALTIFNKNNR